MRIVCISDTHNQHDHHPFRQNLPDGDLLIHSGDFGIRGTEQEVRNFAQWCRYQTERYEMGVVCISGNHDIYTEHNIAETQKKFKFPNVHYLLNDSVTINDFKIYGSPYTPEFCAWAFNLPRNGKQLKDVWEQIPEDTDILVTHGPPYGILDWSIYSQEHVGCELLEQRVRQLTRLKLHIFGHIHHSYSAVEKNNITFVNASICTEEYKPTNIPIVVDLS